MSEDRDTPANAEAERAESLLRGGATGIALIALATAGLAAAGALIAWLVALLV